MHNGSSQSELKQEKSTRPNSSQGKLQRKESPDARDGKPSQSLQEGNPMPKGRVLYILWLGFSFLWFETLCRCDYGKS